MRIGTCCRDAGGEYGGVRLDGEPVAEKVADCPLAEIGTTSSGSEARTGRPFVRQRACAHVYQTSTAAPRVHAYASANNGPWAFPVVASIIRTTMNLRISVKDDTTSRAEQQ